eukprot:CAMPEP_0206206532 /NCGR_PEP_ID=MMETSP0166-20121206/15004_1 /ASSEMBLY_ACC=CAM_ASM_000260 /TAXON_ID=95228 /ORGANISM="Vannella robusta, Strain DIVA3 518/3/11/1/6" /LENGTH=657 /DNA_ID=CAMNT_0053627025 /DNA_START=25 /DNA_END=1999 /DNA_ORIENTATION=+
MPSNTTTVNASGFGRFHDKEKSRQSFSSSAQQIPSSASIHSQRFYTNSPGNSSSVQDSQLNPFTGRKPLSTLVANKNTSTEGLPAISSFSFPIDKRKESPAYHAISTNSTPQNSGNKDTNRLDATRPPFISNTAFPRLGNTSNQAPSIPNLSTGSTQVLNQDELAEAKKKLKTPSNFASAVLQISKMMESHLDSRNKQKFYGALVTVSFSLGTQRFDPKDAKPLFDTALGSKCKSKWSSGYLSNITEWNEIVNKMIAGTWDPDTSREETAGSVPLKLPVLLCPLVLPIQLHEHLLYKLWEQVNNSPLFGSSLLNILLGSSGRAGFDPRMLSWDDPSSDSDDCDDKPYPFYQFTPHPHLIEPVGLRHSNSVISVSLHFVISPEISKLIHSEHNPTSTYFVHLLSYTKQGSEKVGTKSPQHLSYNVNGKAVSISGSGEAVKFGYNITSLCVLGENNLQITAYKCCCTFEFGVRLVQNMSQSLLEDVKNEKLTREQSLAAIKNSFASQGDIVELHITLSLMCPLGQMFIETPVRGRNCKHLQCFDLETFLLMNKTAPTWTCPVCNRNTEVSDLVVDEFMAEILQKVGSDDVGESIKIDENGKWELFSIEFGDHSESDDDEAESLLTKRELPTDLPVAAPPPKIMRSLAPPPKPLVIDLTL